MATIDLNSDPTKPATHALIIGVGEYRHLLGGVQPNAEDWGLGQLPGAAVSAGRFLDWMRANFRNPDAPLASIEHLITGAAGSKLSSEEPTMLSISTAFSRWKGRLSSHRDNIAVLYFAGHGILKGTETGLLAADFARPDNANIMSGAIHVEETVQGMFSCRADRQFFIIDACRTTEEPLLEMMTRPGLALASAKQSDVRTIAHPVIFASEINQASYQVGTSSPFTNALIESLEGMGADDTNGGWGPGQCSVDTDSLLKGINAAMGLERRRRPFLYQQKATFGGSGSFIFHYPKGQISVPLIVGCDPTNLNASATLRILQNGLELHLRGPQVADLKHPVPPDSYWTTAELHTGSTARQKVLVTPPYREVRFRDFIPISHLKTT